MRGIAGIVPTSILSLTTTAAPGQDAIAEAPVKVGAVLEWGVLGGLWAPRLGGTSRLGPSSIERIDFETDVDLNSVEDTFFLDVFVGEVASWRFRVNAFDFETSGQGQYDGAPTSFGSVPLAPGDAYASSVDMTSIAADFRFDGFGTPIDADARLRMAPTVAGRWIDVKQHMSANGFDSHGEGEWIAVPFGLDLEIDWSPSEGLALGRSLRIDAGFAVGPAFARRGDIGFAWEVRAGIVWEPIDHVGIQFGYRLLELDASDESFDFDAGLQGLTAGVSIRF